MSALDPKALDALRADMGDEGVVRDLIRSFLAEAPALVEAGRTGWAAGRRGDAQRAFHTLKSTAATFGAMRLAEAARAAEQACRDGRTPDAAAIAVLCEEASQELEALAAGGVGAGSGP
jgi:two-component system, sensor histidine kinase and response regulator